jgi:hypothetical protein
MPSRTPKPPPIAAPILDHHLENNRKSAGLWEDFGGHRDKVTALVAAAGGETLAVLGAGNCNDLDLVTLSSSYREIHLLDLDRAAVTQARDRLPPAVAAKLVIHAPVDFSGSYARLPGWRRQAFTAPQLAALADDVTQDALAALPGLAGRFDTVLSACCLSQIMHSCFLGLGKHAQLEGVAGALARVHVRVLLGLARPGGHALLVSDMVSTETFPLEELWGTRTPLALLGDLEQAGNYLSGTAATFMRRLFTTDPAAAQLVAAPPALLEPWLWRLGPELAFLVYALSVQRRP